MSTPTDLAYEYAATVDGEWGCCHGEEDLRAGGRVPEYDGDEFEPLPADCLGAGVVAKWLPLLAAHDAALIAKAKAEGAAEALREAADDGAALEAVRLRIEDELVEWRDSAMFMARRNGFTIANRDGSPSGIVRFGTEIGFRIGLNFLADRAAGIEAGQ